MGTFDRVYRLSRKIKGFDILLRIMYGCDIPYEATIGENVKFAHSALGVVVHPDSIIEDGVFIQHHVTIGVNHSKEEGVPIIRKNAFIGPYAMILGGVEVGENAKVGAGTLLMKSIEPDSVYVNNIKLRKLR